MPPVTQPAPERRAPGWWATGAGLAGGLLLDRLIGDPPRGHPVASFGRVAGAGERLLYADARLPGAAYAALLVGGATGLGVVAGRTPGGTAPRVLLTALTAWSVLGGTTLRREAAAMSTLLQATDLPGLGGACRTCAAVTPGSSTAPGWRGPSWSRSPRTPATPTSGHWCGGRCSACQACSATAP